MYIDAGQEIETHGSAQIRFEKLGGEQAKQRQKNRRVHCHRIRVPEWIDDIDRPRQHIRQDRAQIKNDAKAVKTA